MGVRLLGAQKPVNRPGWWKGKFAFLQVPATVRGGWWTSVRRPTPLPDTRQAGGEGIYRESGWGLHAETAESSLTVILNWSSVV